MFKSIARLLIVLMSWNTIGFAQQAIANTDSGPQGAATTSQVWDPAQTTDTRVGYRLLRGLDKPVNPDTYVVGPSDQFVLLIRGGVETEIRLRVLPEGTVLLPNVGAVVVAGMTITEMRAMLKKRLGPYYHNVDLDCQLLVPRTILVYVLGEVERPGPVELLAPFRLDMALAGAGGLSNRATSRAIQIVEDGELARSVDFIRFLRVGDLSQNPSLQEGKTVFVPPRRASCVVMGEVWRGGTLEILEGETIADMVELAGGLTTHALTDRMVHERLDTEQKLTVSKFHWDEAAGIKVQDQDVIVVPDRKSFPGTDFVRVYGGGGREGLIQISEGETLAEFLPRIMRLKQNHDLKRAVIERTDADGATHYIPVDLQAIIDGTDAGSLVLEAGDVISVPLFEEFVYVVGGVVAPGPIPFQRGLPAERYVSLAGGPSERGSMDRLEIVSMDGVKRGANRNSTVFRGETILVKQKKSRIFQSMFVSLTSLTSLVLSIIAVSRTN